MVTAGGAETLPFLASCGVLPASLAFFVLYGRVLDLHLQRSWVRACFGTCLLGLLRAVRPRAGPPPAALLGALHPRSGSNN